MTPLKFHLDHCPCSFYTLISVSSSLCVFLQLIRATLRSEYLIYHMLNLVNAVYLWPFWRLLHCSLVRVILCLFLYYHHFLVISKCMGRLFQKNLCHLYSPFTAFFPPLPVSFLYPFKFGQINPIPTGEVN